MNDGMDEWVKQEQIEGWMFEWKANEWMINKTDEQIEGKNWMINNEWKVKLDKWINDQLNEWTNESLNAECLKPCWGFFLNNES